MPSLVLTSLVEGFAWQVTGLSSVFSSENYTEIGITTAPVQSGATSLSGSIVSRVRPSPSTSGGYATPEIAVGYSPGTYTFYAYALVPAGSYWPAGSGTVVVQRYTPVRPSNWEWWSTVQSGKPVNISANEWLVFCGRIDEFRRYAGLGDYGFTGVGSNWPFRAIYFNQALDAISQIPGHGTLPSLVSPGNPLSASAFNMLKNALNAVP